MYIEHFAERYYELRCVEVFCDALRSTAVRFGLLQSVAVRCNELRCVIPSVFSVYFQTALILHPFVPYIWGWHSFQLSRLWTFLTQRKYEIIEAKIMVLILLCTYLKFQSILLIFFFLVTTTIFKFYSSLKFFQSKIKIKKVI